MRIVVASNGLDVSPYFESCSNYNYFTLENGELVDYRNLPILNPQDHSVIDILKELDVDTIIVGCLKKSSRDFLESVGITVLCGAKGDAKKTIESFMDDTFIACDGSCDERESCLEENDYEALLDAI